MADIDRRKSGTNSFGVKQRATKVSGTEKMDYINVSARPPLRQQEFTMKELKLGLNIDHKDRKFCM